MKCFQCGNEIKGNGILLNVDGDFVCDVTCKKAYEKKRDHFFNDIMHSSKKTEAWLRGEID